MPKLHQPRSGSMQFWPRKRAKRAVARVRSWATTKEAIPQGFLAYKAGMTHIIATEESKGSHLKGESLHIPVTVLECPPMRIFGIRAYQKAGTGIRVAKEMLFKGEKALDMRLEIKKPKTAKDIDTFKPEEYEYFTILAHTQPKATMMGKKIPDVLEIHLGGKPEEQLTFVKEHLEKPIAISDIFKEGDLTDIHAVTKGKGFMGPIRRFGIGLKGHKSEKGRRAPGSLGGWIAQGHTQYRVPRAGQMGFHLRTQYNTPIFKISDKPEEINPKGGFIRFGNVKSTYILVKGSIHGSKRRAITLTKPIRNPKPVRIQTITHMHTGSHQGV